MRRIDELGDDERAEILDRRGSTGDVADDVRRILDAVRRDGDDALREFTEEFDGVVLESLAVDESRMKSARDELDDGVVEAIETSAERIRGFHEKQVRDDWRDEDDGVEVGRRFVPLGSAGAYVPGGGAAYPSTALMTVLPARVAGVERVVACTPPEAHPATLAALDVAGVDDVYEVGGAQAVGAMAYGTESVGKVDAVVGPGNVYVTAAKRLVRDDVRVEFPAGPSEIGVVADASADARFVAADVLAQSEHDTDARAVVVTTSEELARQVEEEVERQLEGMERRDTADEVRKDVLVGSLDDCVGFMNEYAPEHLSIVTENDEEVLERVHNAGSVFLGGYTPIAAGDYATGTNHVLPTAGGARLYGGLSVDDFVRGVTVQRLSREGLGELADTVTTLARVEGLSKHADSVEIRRDG